MTLQNVTLDSGCVLTGLPGTPQGGRTTALDEAAIVATTDVTGRIVYVNEKFCRISGYAREELINANHRLLRSGLHDREFFRAMYRIIARGGTWHGELCNRAKDGSFYWVDTTIVPRRGADGRIAFYDAIRFDITPLKKAEERLWVEARTDVLTGLPNRVRFGELLAENVTACKASGRSVALALLDVDGFKDTNDSLGHDAGDALLRVVAQRLRDLVDDEISIARLGGDEFTLIIPEADDRAALLAVLEAVVGSLREPVAIQGADRRCTVSMGVALFPDHAAKPAELMKNADIALYRAKARGRDRFELFDPSMAEVVSQRAVLHQQAERALRNSEFRLFFQPILDISGATPTVTGLEALLRWRHPEHGLIAPGRFFEVFDHAGLCAEIGRYVAATAIRQTAEWSRAGLDFDKVAINVTSADLHSDGLGSSLLAMIRETGLEAEKFCIEVTEGMFLGRGSERTLAMLAHLHEAGLKIALDDFGTGFASLTHLKSLPIDRIKIDRSFVDQIEYDRANRAIVHGLIRIAHSLGLRVTAEGIETQAQLRELIGLGCDQVQGYLIGRPMHPAKIPHFVRQFERTLLTEAGRPEMGLRASA